MTDIKSHVTLLLQLLTTGHIAHNSTSKVPQLHELVIGTCIARQDSKQ